MSDDPVTPERPPKPPKPPLPPPPSPGPSPSPGPAPAPASSRRFTFETQALDPSARAVTFEVVQMRGEESISRPFRFELLLASAQPRVDLDAVLKADARLTIFPPKASDKAAPYHGCLAEFDQLHQVNDQLYLYRAVLVPHLWKLSQYRQSNVYLNTAIDDIVTTLLKTLGDLADQSASSTATDLPAGFKDMLKRPGGQTYYAKREYVCQYQETPLDFISRWMEKEGIYYYFEHEQRKSELLVLLDDRTAQADEAFDAQYQSVGHRGADQSPNSVQGFICRTRPVIDGVELREFDPREAAKAPQRSEYLRPAQAAFDPSWPGAREGVDMRYGENARPEIGSDAEKLGMSHEARRYAQVRAQERFAEARVFYGEATAVGLRSGKLMRLTGHFREPDGSAYLITEITHEGSQADVVAPGVQLPGSRGTEGQHQTYYRNSFVALPSDTQYRTPLRTARPQIAGTLSATIDGTSAESVRQDAEKAAKQQKPTPSDADIKKAGDAAAESYVPYADLDDQGRYCVRLPFDAVSRGVKQASAPMRMATPYSGEKHGMHLPLLKGAEVLLAFADGDPDQPVILAAVPNSVNRNVVTDANKTKNRLLTQGGNEIVLDDRKDAQAIWLYSPPNKSLIGIGQPSAKSPSVTPADETAEQKSQREKNERAQGVNAQAEGYDVKSGTGILLATTGKIQQIQQESEASFWGTKFSVAAGNSTGVSASFDTKLSWGASVGISASSDVKWSMDMIPSPDAMLETKLLPKWAKAKSVSISDSSSAKFMSESDDTSAAKGLSFAAGVRNTDPNWWTVKAYKRTIKLAMAAYFSSVIAYQKVRNGDIEKLAQKGGHYVGLNAIQPLHTAAFLLAVQGWSRQMAGKLGDLELVSRAEVDTAGVRLAVNGLGRDDQLNALGGGDAGSADIVRSEITLDVAEGAKIASGTEADMITMLGSWPALGTATPATASWASFASGGATVAGGTSIDLQSPAINLSSPSDASSASMKLSHARKALEMKGGGASLTLNDTGIVGVANEVKFGSGASIPNPLLTALSVQADAAHKAWNVARRARLKAEWKERTARGEDAQAAATAFADAARELETKLKKASTEAGQRHLSAVAVQDADVLVGLTATRTKASLVGGGASVQTSAQGVSLSFGASSLQLTAQGIEHGGPLIRIG